MRKQMVGLVVLFVSGCYSGQEEMNSTIDVKQGAHDMETMILLSRAFIDGGPIPTKYTCDGADISPPLKWKNAPKETKTFALICDDPDAPKGVWVHWVVFNIPANVSDFSEAVNVEELGATIGTNTWGNQNYGGPCPPKGMHRYYFKLYALDRELALDAQATKEDVLKAMEGAILAQAAIMGRYERSQ